jgi:hypothetical protein
MPFWLFELNWHKAVVAHIELGPSLAPIYCTVHVPKDDPYIYALGRGLGNAPLVLVLIALVLMLIAYSFGPCA